MKKSLLFFLLLGMSTWFFADVELASGSLASLIQ